MLSANSFGNALGNSIVGEIEAPDTTPHFQFDSSQVPGGSATNSYALAQQSGVLGSSSDALLASTITLPADAAVQSLEAGLPAAASAPIAGTDTGGGSTALVAQASTEQAYLITQGEYFQVNVATGTSAPDYEATIPVASQNYNPVGNPVYDDGEIQTYADPYADPDARAISPGVDVTAADTAQLVANTPHLDLNAASQQLLSDLYSLPGTIRNGLQDNLVAYGSQAGPVGSFLAGVAYSALPVVLPFDTYGGAAAGVAGGEALGAVARIPGVSAVLNTNLDPYLARAGQAGLDFIDQLASGPVSGSFAAQRGSINLNLLVPGSGATADVAETVAPGIEAQFQANSLRVATEAHDLFAQGVADSTIPLNPRLSYNLQAGNFVDDAVRESNIALRDDLGLGPDTVRINQRLYTPNGNYSVPDLYFPQSGNIIDYSYQLKTLDTPQIQRFISASPNGTITIVPPAQVRPVYTLGQ